MREISWFPSSGRLQASRPISKDNSRRLYLIESIIFGIFLYLRHISVRITLFCRRPLWAIPNYVAYRCHFYNSISKNSRFESDKFPFLFWKNSENFRFKISS